MLSMSEKWEAGPFLESPADETGTEAARKTGSARKRQRKKTAKTGLDETTKPEIGPPLPPDYSSSVAASQPLLQHSQQLVHPPRRTSIVDFFAPVVVAPASKLGLAHDVRSSSSVHSSGIGMETYGLDGQRPGDANLKPQHQLDTSNASCPMLELEQASELERVETSNSGSLSLINVASVPLGVHGPKASTLQPPSINLEPVVTLLPVLPVRPVHPFFHKSNHEPIEEDSSADVPMKASKGKGKASKQELVMECSSNPANTAALAALDIDQTVALSSDVFVTKKPRKVSVRKKKKKSDTMVEPPAEAVPGVSHSTNSTAHHSESASTKTHSTTTPSSTVSKKPPPRNRKVPAPLSGLGTKSTISAGIKPHTGLDTAAIVDGVKELCSVGNINTGNEACTIVPALVAKGEDRRQEESPNPVVFKLKVADVQQDEHTHTALSFGSSATHCGINVNTRGETPGLQPIMETHSLSVANKQVLFTQFPSVLAPANAKTVHPFFDKNAKKETPATMSAPPVVVTGAKLVAREDDAFGIADASSAQPIPVKKRKRAPKKGSDPEVADETPAPPKMLPTKKRVGVKKILKITGGGIVSPVPVPIAALIADPASLASLTDASEPVLDMVSRSDEVIAPAVAFSDNAVAIPVAPLPAMTLTNLHDLGLDLVTAEVKEGDRDTAADTRSNLNSCSIPTTPNDSVASVQDTAKDKILHPFFDLNARRAGLVGDTVDSNNDSAAGGLRKSRRIIAADKVVDYYKPLDIGEPLEVQEQGKGGKVSSGKSDSSKVSDSKPNLKAKPSSVENRPPPRVLTDEELLTANPFFLSNEQKRMQKMLQDQAQLLKEIEDRHALSAEFSKGKSINPFLQKRAVSGINESGMSGSNAISLDSSEADMNRVWEKGSAPFPTSLNAHVNHSNSFCLETGAFEIATPFKLKGRLSKKVDGIPILENVWKLKLVNSTEYIQEDSFEVGRDLIPANCREAWRVSCLDTSRGGLPTVLQVAETQLESFLEQIHSTTKLSQSPPLKKLWEDVVSWKPFRMEADSLVSWSDKFRPTSVEDILGAHNSSNAKAVKDWLLGWKGLGGGNTSDLKQVSTDPPAVLKQIPKLQNFKRVFDSDFIVDDEADGDYLEEIDDCSMQARSTSVSDDDDVFQSSHGEGRKRRRREKKAWKKSRVEDQLKSQHLRLIGPSSSGRSCCVKAIADECGFDVLEIHAGQKRSGKEVQSLLAEATQSHAVGDTATMAAAAVASTAVTESAASNVKSAFASLFAQKAEKASSLIGIDKEALGSKKKRRFVLDDDGSDEGAEIDVITVNRMACANAPQSRPTLILIEDADIVFDQDKGFWVAIWSILEVSKRPIVFICNDDPFSHQNLTVPSNLLSNLLNATIALQFQAPSFSDLFCYLHLIVLNEGYWINPEDIAALCHDSGYNMRKCLNAAELLCRTGGQQLSTSLATLSTLQVPTGRMREFNVRHARGSSDQALPVLDWASIALQPLPDPKLTVLQELDLIADVAENISMFNRLGKLRNFEEIDTDTYFGIDILPEDASSLYPALMNDCLDSNLCTKTTSLSEDINQTLYKLYRAKPFPFKISCDDRMRTNDNNSRVLALPISIFPLHYCGASPILRHEYLPFLSGMCSDDAEKAHLHRLDVENGEGPASMPTKTAGSRRILRRKNAYVRHFEEVLTEAEARSLMRRMKSYISS